APRAVVPVSTGLRLPTLDVVTAVPDGATRPASDDGSGTEPTEGATSAASPDAKIEKATASLTALLDKAQTGQIDIEPAPDTPAEVLRAEVKGARKAARTLA